MSNSEEENRRQGISYWSEIVKKKKRLLVFFGENVLDLTQFSKTYSRCRKVINIYLLKDMKNAFSKNYPYSKKEESELLKYSCGKLIIEDIAVQIQENPKGIFKKSVQLKREVEKKKVSFETSRVQAQQPEKKKKINSLFENLQQNLGGLEQNKTDLIIPHFDAKFYFDQISKYAQSLESQSLVTNIE